MSILLAKAFKESLTAIYKNGTKTSIGILTGSIDSYLARNMYSKTVLDDLNFFILESKTPIGVGFFCFCAFIYIILMGGFEWVLDFINALN